MNAVLFFWNNLNLASQDLFFAELSATKLDVIA